jgi:hypothetical protein
LNLVKRITSCKETISNKSNCGILQQDEDRNGNYAVHLEKAEIVVQYANHYKTILRTRPIRSSAVMHLTCGSRPEKSIAR